MMIIGQFINSFEVDEKWKHTFMYYNKHKELVRLDTDPDLRFQGYTKMLNNMEQHNKNKFRLFIEF